MILSQTDKFSYDFLNTYSIVQTDTNEPYIGFVKTYDNL